MGLNGLQDGSFLNAVTVGIQEIFETAASYLLRTRPLTYLDRLPMVDAEDGELYGRFVAEQFIADIITENAPANVYKGGRFELAQVDLGKVKIGSSMNETELAKLNAWQMRGGLTSSGEDQYSTWLGSWMTNLLYSVMQRQNWLAASMYLDDFSYDRWGVKVSSASSPWGMPANLKVTTSIAWSSDSGATGNSSATPLSDIFTMDQVAADEYGLPPYDRITMSRFAFRSALKSDEFRDAAFRILDVKFTPTAKALMLSQDGTNKELLSRLLDKEVIIDDATYTHQAADGSRSSNTRYLPKNKVILDRKANSTAECDFGNGIVTESIVAGMTGVTDLQRNPRWTASGARGPLGYITAPKDLNPPSVTGWGVSRCWPRRHKPECSAVLTVW